MRSLVALTFTTALVLGGCATGPNVRVDRDPASQPSQYRTFAFYEPSASQPARYSTLTAERLRAATRARLESLGYVYAEQAPEMRVNFVVAVQDRQDVRASTTTPRGVPVYRAWGGYVDLDTVHYKVGTLAIDLVDARRNALVWRGIAEGRLDEKALREPGDTVAQAVNAIFAKLPAAGASPG